ncbi:TRAP transporter large permease [Paracoccus sp. Z330]|uniref:TRAP transporter large permease n=1 Tax=Paracoccus onchidii TaxID=3017813 RepID=A0ABT4ZGJ5_9RHOB|nr:TRAP transporter large permease [Paracoccus onchidii]MDB6178458.1 TRAP transporter large permease [Paracoccus onchidii]
MSIIAAVAFIVLLILSVPIAHALLMASGVAMLQEEPMFLFEAILNLYQPTSSFPMLAIPFFILAGDIMMSGRFGEYLVNFSKMLVGWMKGGLAQVSVLGSLFFGGVSGSAVADASALGNALIPVQKRQGYPDGFPSAVNAATSTISVLIPPSIPLILYGLITETSIPKLFIAGIVPGIILTVLFFLCCYVIAQIRDLPRSPVEPESSFELSALFDARDLAIIIAANILLGLLYFGDILGGLQIFAAALAMMAIHLRLLSRRFALRKVPAQLWRAIPALLMPLLVVILARGGVVTPTEISVFAVAYAIIVGAFVYRDLTLPRFLGCVLSAGMMTGVIMLVIMSSSVLQWILTFESVPENLANWMLDTLQEPWAIILGMNLLMIVIGTFLDLPAAVLLLAPIFAGVAPHVGIDQVQLGVMMVVNLAIGLYTPPVGTTLFVSLAIERVPMSKIVFQLWPFYLVAITLLALVSFYPAFSTFLIG